MSQRIGLIVMVFAACFCSSAHGQVYSAGCMQGPNCGAKGSGSGTGSAKPASNPPNPTAAAMNAMQNNLQHTTQIINNAGAAILNALQPNNDSNADAAANASQILHESQSYMGSATGASGATQSPSGNAAAAVNSLLDPGQPSTASNSAISALLGDPTPPSAAAPTPVAAIADLLGLPTPQPNEALAQPAPAPSAIPSIPMAPMDHLAQDSINPVTNVSQNQIGPATSGTKTAWTDDPQADPNYQATVLIGRPQLNSVVDGVQFADDLMTSGVGYAGTAYVVGKVQDLLYGDALKGAASDKGSSLYNQYHNGLGMTSKLPTPAPAPPPNPQ